MGRPAVYGRPTRRFRRRHRHSGSQQRPGLIGENAADVSGAGDGGELDRVLSRWSSLGGNPRCMVASAGGGSAVPARGRRLIVLHPPARLHAPAGHPSITNERSCSPSVREPRPVNHGVVTLERDKGLECLYTSAPSHFVVRAIIMERRGGPESKCSSHRRFGHSEPGAGVLRAKKSSATMDRPAVTPCLRVCRPTRLPWRFRRL
jgi:hypothetical protein